MNRTTDLKPVTSATISSNAAAESSPLLASEPCRSQESADWLLDGGWSLGISRLRQGVALRLSHPQQEAVEMEIAITPRGPIVRARATALVLDSAEEIVAHCERFLVEARSSITLRAEEIRQEASGLMHAAGSEVELKATDGSLRASANDDVQLLGEQILLNCDREPPVPQWISPPSAPESILERQNCFGDISLFDTLPTRHGDGG